MSAREINALLAVHLFGWQWQKDSAGNDYLGIVAQPELEPIWHLVLDPYCYLDGVNWPTTWQGMGQVVEAMKAKGWAYDIHAGSSGQTKATFFADERPGIAFAFEWADIAPMAVALAALKALGVEVEVG